MKQGIEKNYCIDKNDLADKDYGYQLVAPEIRTVRIDTVSHIEVKVPAEELGRVLDRIYNTFKVETADLADLDVDFKVEFLE